MVNSSSDDSPAMGPNHFNPEAMMIRAAQNSLHESAGIFISDEQAEGVCNAIAPFMMMLHFMMAANQCMESVMEKYEDFFGEES